MTDSMRYEEAMEELQAIVQEIEEGKVNIDVLAEKIQRASVLLKFCKNKLTSTEKAVGEILKELED